MSLTLGFQQPITTPQHFPRVRSSGTLRGRMHRSADAHKLYDSRRPRPWPQSAVIISRPLAAPYIVGLHFSTIKLFSDGRGIGVFAFASSDDGVEQHVHVFGHSHCDSVGKPSAS